MPTNVDPINTAPIQQFIQQVKQADSGRQKEVRIDINTAKNLAFTLGIVMTRLHGDLERLVKEAKTAEENEIIEVQMDGGSGWK
jgi:hypothetical protein